MGSIIRTKYALFVYRTTLSASFYRRMEGTSSGSSCQKISLESWSKSLVADVRGDTDCAVVIQDLYKNLGS